MHRWLMIVVSGKREKRERKKQKRKKEKKQRERKDKKEIEKLSRFFTDVTRKKENIKRKKVN